MTDNGGGLRESWSIERRLSVINIGLVIVVAVLTIVGWFPKWGMDRLAYAAHLQTPTVPQSNLTVKDLGDLGDGTHCYDVNYSVNTKNQSDRPVRITYAIAELYIGEVHFNPLRDGEAYEINGPPNPWDPIAYGQIRPWRRVTYDASQIDGGAPDKVKRFFDQHGLEDRSPGGGMTGIVAPGDSTGEAPHFIVRAKPRDYIGAVVAYGIDDATASPSPKINQTTDVKHLEEIAPAKEAEPGEGPAKRAAPSAARDHCVTSSP